MNTSSFDEYKKYGEIAGRIEEALTLLERLTYDPCVKDMKPVLNNLFNGMDNLYEVFRHTSGMYADYLCPSLAKVDTANVRNGCPRTWYDPEHRKSLCIPF